MAFLPGWAKSDIREISFLFFFFSFFLFLLRRAPEGDAEISSIEIRAELPAAVEKSGEVVF
jgi:hypothetical protein